MKTMVVDVLPKQDDFVGASEREVLYSGAFGAGKTRALCLKAVARASGRLGAREGLCRKHLVTLKATTLRVLLEPDGALPPVLLANSYVHNKSEKIIRLHGGGEIVYFGLDDPRKIGSYQLTGCGVDQAEELAEADWRQLRGRCRVKVEGLNNQLYAACNPAAPSHFLAIRFGLVSGHKAPETCRVIRTKSNDNWFLPADYLADLGTFTGVAKARYVDGLWVGAEGLVYDHWSREGFVRERLGPWKRVVIGADEGYTNPAVLLVIGEDGDGRLHVFGEFYKAKQLEPVVIGAAVRLNEAHSPEAIIVDPSAAELIAAMRSAGLPVVPAHNAVFAGIQGVQRRLAVPLDGRPRLTVDPCCENLIREFETYEWKQGTAGAKDEPVKQYDHALDALRYAIAYIDGFGRVAVGMMADTGQAQDEIEELDPFDNEALWVTHGDA